MGAPLRLTGELALVGVEEDAFGDFADLVLEHLIHLQEQEGHIVDPDMAGSLTDRSLIISLGVRSSRGQDAEAVFLASVQKALRLARDRALPRGVCPHLERDLVVSPQK